VDLARQCSVSWIFSAKKSWAVSSILEPLPKALFRKPEHPLISVINLDLLEPVKEPISLIFDFYSISIKRALNTKYKYGQQEFDFDEGVLFFIAPNQVFSREVGDNATRPSGWILSIHPDFLWNTPLAKTIKQYEYFDYSANEALHLSEKEEIMIINILKFIEQEYHTNIDKFSQNVIITQIELFTPFYAFVGVLHQQIVVMHIVS